MLGGSARCVVIAALALVSIAGHTHAVAAEPVLSAASIRVFDSRPGHLTFDGQQSGGGALEAGTTARVLVSGRTGVPADAVLFRVTAADPAAAGFLSVGTCDGTPTTSTLNFSARQTVTNISAGSLDGGSLCVYASARTHLVVDLVGDGLVTIGAPGSPPIRFPNRLVDTRSVPGHMVPAGAAVKVSHPYLLFSMLVVNVTALGAREPGWVGVRGCGDETVPSTSILNFTTSAPVANMAVVPNCGEVVTSAEAHLVVDVVATLFTGSPPTGLSPGVPGSWSPSIGFRLFDTRMSAGRLRAGTPTVIELDQPLTTGLYNVVAVHPDSPGYVVVYSCEDADDAVPAVSTVNYGRGDVRAALTVLAGGDHLCAYSTAPTDLVIDTTIAAPIQ